MLSNNEWVNNEIKEEIKKCLEKNENEHTTTHNLWDTSGPERKIHSSIGLTKENRKISSKQPNPASKRTREITINKVQN